MPSNTFKASQLIAHLQALMEAYGDKDVILPVKAADVTFSITDRDVRAVSTVNGRDLRRVVFAIEPQAPVQEYGATAESALNEAWNYDLAAAPEGEPLRIYKRIGGEGTGFRKDGIWFLTRAEGRPVAFAPGGVLGWRK